MPVIYDTETKGARMAAARDMVDGGALDLMDASGAVLASWPLPAPAGVISGTTWALSPVDPLQIASASGVPAQVRIRDANSIVRVTGITAGRAGFGIEAIIDRSVVTAGQPVRLLACFISHAIEPGT